MARDLLVGIDVRMGGEKKDVPYVTCHLIKSRPSGPVNGCQVEVIQCASGTPAVKDGLAVRDRMNLNGNKPLVVEVDRDTNFVFQGKGSPAIVAINVLPGWSYRFDDTGLVVGQVAEKVADKPQGQVSAK